MSLEGKRQKIWIIESEGEVVGCVAIVRNSEEECQLRWLILHPKLRGKGYGKSLVAEAISFSRKMGYKSIILWTFNELEVAIKIYKGFGFVKVEEKAHYIWGRNLVEEKYELLL